MGWGCLKLIATFKEDKGVGAQKIDLSSEQPIGYGPSPLGKIFQFEHHCQWCGDGLVEIWWIPWLLIGQI